MQYIKALQYILATLRLFCKVICLVLRSLFSPPLRDFFNKHFSFYLFGPELNLSDSLKIALTLNKQSF